MRLDHVLWVFLGAGAGGALRYALGTLLVERWGTAFPWHTLIINVSGAFLLGVLMAFTAHHTEPSAVRLLLGVGVLGGFTTFSTLSYEAVSLITDGAPVAGVTYVVASGVLGIAASVSGLMLGRAV